MWDIAQTVMCTQKIKGNQAVTSTTEEKSMQQD